LGRAVETLFKGQGSEEAKRKLFEEFRRHNPGSGRGG